MRPVLSSPRRYAPVRVPVGIGILGLAILGIATLCLASPATASAAGLAVDASVITHQTSASNTITSGALSTSNPNDLLVAFIASDGPNRPESQSIASVTGGGLTWKLRQRANAQAGTAEIWEAVAPSPLSGATITATRSTGVYVGSIDVVAFSGADINNADGAVGSANAASGTPLVSLTSSVAGSWVWGVGNDWDNAEVRTAGPAQTLFDQDLAGVDDTYWVQSETTAGDGAGTPVTLNDTAPANDRWDFSAIEVIPRGADTQPPTVPTDLTAKAVNADEVDLSWSASTDNVAVVGYDILRNGTQIGTSAGSSHQDLSVSPSTTYNYTVEAYDGAGNISQTSNAAIVATPAASSNPPVISNVMSSGVTSTSATVSWTTDMLSGSRVLYGTSPNYGETTPVDTAQVTSHSQTIMGLSPGTTYHFAVQSTGSSANTATSADNTFTTLATNVTLPDMQIKVPTNAISIGTNSPTGHRQLQFTHITWDAGTGPFEIDPNYNSSTGTATFTQAIYSSLSPGTWTYDYSVPLPVTGVFHEPFDYQFPLTKFTLNNVNPDGSLGSVVATSPKTDYCITGDAYVGGVPNTPDVTFIPQSNCESATKPLGWSVGWGDEYDQTDSGQPIDLTGVPDGIYILEGTVDPDHVLTESDPTNNVVDTKVEIIGDNVTVLSQTNRGTTPPVVSMTSPVNDATVSGTVTLKASASVTPPATVASVQFLLDGQPLGSPVTSSPYAYNWTVGSTSPGNHTLSAQVSDSNGGVATAHAITVDVVASDSQPANPAVSITNPTNNETLSAAVPVAANATDNGPISSVQFYLDGQTLGNAVTTSPYSVSWDTTQATNGTHTLTAKVTDSGGNAATSAPVTVNVQNPAPPMTCFVLQAEASVHGKGMVTTPSFHTAMAGETLLAFVSSDGPRGAAQQSGTVSGAGLTWTLVKRANAQSGDAEVWRATVPAVLSSATVTSTPLMGGYSQELTVVAYEGVDGVGASAAASGASGVPSVSLTTTASTSLVFAVGNDWDNAIPRTLPSGWTMLDQWTNTAYGDDYWSQYTNTPTGAAGSMVTASDTAPTNDSWNVVAVELLGDAG